MAATVLYSAVVASYLGSAVLVNQHVPEPYLVSTRLPVKNVMATTSHPLNLANVNRTRYFMFRKLSNTVVEIGLNGTQA